MNISKAFEKHMPRFANGNGLNLYLRRANEYLKELESLVTITVAF